MKTLVIKEFGDFVIPNSVCFDLTKTELKDCIGCWTCWLKTPGVCIHKDLEDFYRSYVSTDKTIIFAKPEHGFVSAKLNTLLDRMLPIVLPYVVIQKGTSWHMPRYPKYPDIELYYDCDFADGEESAIFYDYIQKVFKQFYSKKIDIRPISAFRENA